MLDIPEIPDELKEIYKTAWEIKQKTIIDMAADRGAYICQSQSMNVFMSDVNFAKLTSMHFHAWKSGLKTGMYYLRTKAAANAVKFTIQKQAEVALEPKTAAVAVDAAELSKEEALAQMACSLDNPDVAKLAEVKNDPFTTRLLGRPFCTKSRQYVKSS